jgi:hypothetical protein
VRSTTFLFTTLCISIQLFGVLRVWIGAQWHIRPAAPRLRHAVLLPAPPGAARHPRPRTLLRWAHTPRHHESPRCPRRVPRQAHVGPVAPARGCLPSVPPCSMSVSLLYKAPEPPCSPRAPTPSAARRDRRHGEQGRTAGRSSPPTKPTNRSPVSS